MTTYLQTRADAALAVPETLTAEQIAESERERLADQLNVAVSASQIPRRLSEGSREEQAIDKKRSRRIAHALNRSLLLWGGEGQLEPSSDQRSRGAQIDWPSWWDQHEAWLVARIRFVASWALATEQKAQGRSYVVLLENELRWLKYALRQ